MAGRSGYANRIYLCIDLKSFYASVECIDRGLDPFETRLVVADLTRTEKTICLAVSPALKALGVPGRCRVFEIPDGIDYEVAPPRMRHYMEVSARIYEVYLRYIAPSDIHVYSIDECFIDATPYLPLYGKNPRELALMLMDAVRDETGICASAGIGTNLFLAKVALDITAKHVDGNVGFLDEGAFKAQIWHHVPITDIWNIGPGIARRLERLGVRDLQGITELDVDVLYREFGVNAEYLIDHAWGVEPCTIAEIQAYRPETTSLSNGQVFGRDRTREETRTVLREMVDALVLELVEKRLVCDSISLTIVYADDRGPGDSRDGAHGDGRLEDGAGRWRHGEHGGGVRRMSVSSNSFKLVWGCFERLFDETAMDRPIHRVYIALCGLSDEDFATMDLFADTDDRRRERVLADTILAAREKFGANSVFKGTSLKDGATGLARGKLIGGHRAG